MEMQIPYQVKLLLELHRLETKGNGANGAQTARRLENNLDPSLLQSYRKARQRKGTGIAVLQNGACSGCHIMYPQSHEMFRHENCVHRCEYCGRLLLVTDGAAASETQ